MNLLRKIGNFNFTTSGIRIFGAMCLLGGVMGSLMQRLAIGTGTMTNAQLFEILETDPAVLQSVTVALAFKALEACGVPIFAFLLVEGTHHTADFTRYLLRVLGLAVLCQLPYNLVMTGNFLYMTGLNPVFGLLMSMVMLYFFRRFPEKKLSHITLKVLAIVGTFLWSNMLGISHGAVCVLLTALLWALWDKPNLRTFGAMMLGFACCIFSLFYIAMPLAFLVLYFYDGEKGNSSRIVNYAIYPAMLVIFGVLSIFL